MGTTLSMGDIECVNFEKITVSTFLLTTLGMEKMTSQVLVFLCFLELLQMQISDMQHKKLSQTTLYFSFLKWRMWRRGRAERTDKRKNQRERGNPYARVFPSSLCSSPHPRSTVFQRDRLCRSL